MAAKGQKRSPFMGGGDEEDDDEDGDAGTDLPSPSPQKRARTDNVCLVLIAGALDRCTEVPGCAPLSHIVHEAVNFVAVIVSSCGRLPIH